MTPKQPENLHEVSVFARVVTPSKSSSVKAYDESYNPNSFHLAEMRALVVASISMSGGQVRTL